MKWRLILALFCFALGTLRAASASLPKIALTHVTIVDIRAGAIKPDMTVLVVGDRISSVRRNNSKEGFPTTEIKVIDGNGKFLLPGFGTCTSTATAKTACCTCFLRTELQASAIWEETLRNSLMRGVVLPREN